MNHFVLKLLKVQIAIYPTSTSPRMSFSPEDCRSVSEMKYLRNSLRTPPDSCILEMIFSHLFMPTGGDKKKNLFSTYGENSGCFRCFEQLEWISLLPTVITSSPLFHS